MTVTVYCDWCGAPIEKFESAIKEHNFCCLAHFHAWQRRHQVEVSCDYCGTLLIKKRSEVHEHNFCCREHANEWLRRNQVTVPCTLCGKPVTKTRSMVQERNFCCREHQFEWRRNRLEVTCDYCGKSLSRPPSLVRSTNFCDAQCRDAWESANRRVELACDWCGMPIVRPKSRLEWVGHHFCSKECTNLWRSQRYSGSGSPHWRGGTSRLPYGPDYTDDLRETIRLRDGHICAMCGSPAKCVHHIDDDKFNNNPSNLITLCRSCHSSITRSRRESSLRSFFQDLIESL